MIQYVTYEHATRKSPVGDDDDDAGRSPKAVVVGVSSLCMSPIHVDPMK